MLIDAAYANSKDLGKRTVLDKIFKGATYEIVLNPKYGGYQKELACIWPINFLLGKRKQDQK